MTGHTFPEQTAMREAVAKYVSDNGVTSLQQIANHVQYALKLEHTPSKSTIARYLRALGYELTEPVHLASTWRKT